MEIRKYIPSDFEKLIRIIEQEGDAWDYWKPAHRDVYQVALEKSITYVAIDKDELCGFSRSIDDLARQMIVCDLLVTRAHRGKGIGRQLLSCILTDFPEKEVYAMSDVDEYYLKQAYAKVGSVIRIL